MMGAEPDTDAADTERLRPGDFIGHAAAVLAVTLFIWTRLVPYAPLGEWGTLFWAGVALWVAAGIFAIRARQHWWVIATLPFGLWSLSSLLLVAACLMGDCL